MAADEVTNLVGVLREASVVLDALWRDALTGSDGESAIRLGEASHGVHRALIALSNFEAIGGSLWDATLSA